MNAFYISLTTIFQLADHALTELFDQPSFTIPASTTLPLVPAGSNFDEINLKQVSIYLFLADFTISFVLIGQSNPCLPLRRRNLQITTFFPSKSEPPPKKKEKK